MIDQWDAIYSQDPLSAILPIRPGGAIGFSGLGVFGGIPGAAIGIILYTRWKQIPIGLGLDTVIPGTLFAQGIARWGNFFNQELYGPPTDAPWAIAIQCQHRVAAIPVRHRSRYEPPPASTRCSSTSRRSTSWAASSRFGCRASTCPAPAR